MHRTTAASRRLFEWHVSRRPDLIDPIWRASYRKVTRPSFAVRAKGGALIFTVLPTIVKRTRETKPLKSDPWRIDPDGQYLRLWIPELKPLPTKWLHAPWTAPQDVLQSAGISLGRTYPTLIVDHSEARMLALKAFQQIKRS